MSRQEEEKGESLTYTIERVAELLGISRGLAYELASQGKIPVIRAGQKRLLVPRKGLEDYLAGRWQPQQAEGTGQG